MEMPNFDRTIMLRNTKGQLFFLSYSESEPFVGLCGQVPSVFSSGIGAQTMPVNMFVGSSVQVIVDQARAWIG
ncbi:hypothetical protein SAMN00768000_0402 [Sulfobacillus thermosulfidooxidans DSM 9293]|uniref:Uncharacterized protein n=1 Tax=Sulfobacillus thermosulfidooxidans (strain DSM 9293 / VKM B-1269 / AT-1) TaxID=929705 RepID=A0A1W1W7B9_SULTA|nr:hypothetical protein SAMN00768000_0402 [Sulfobacillus thermosulfidooxidans DSM 9293]